MGAVFNEEFADLTARGLGRLDWKRKRTYRGKWTDVRRYFADHAQEAAEFIVEIMRNVKAPLDLRFRAAIEVQNRGIGKPAQMVKLASSGAGAYDWSKLNDEQLRQADEILRIASTGVGDTD